MSISKIISSKPLTPSEEKLHNKILELNKLRQVSTLPLESLSPLEKKLAQEIAAVREKTTHTFFSQVKQILSPTEIQAQWYDWGFDRPYYSLEAVSLLTSAALSLAATPILIAKTITHISKSLLSKNEHASATASLKELTQASRFILLGTALGLGKLLLAPVCDTARKIVQFLDAKRNPEGNAALLAIDVQYDFFDAGEISLDGKIHRYEKGSLAVANACQILPPIRQMNALKKQNVTLIASQDWHPLNHYSFAANLGVAPFSTVQLKGLKQMAWPIHCVQHSRGSAFVHGMPTPDLIVKKGQNRTIDSYSAFLENDQTQKTKLQEHLKAANIKTLFIFGLAYDFCVGWSAKDALEAGYKVILIEDATKGILPDQIAETRKTLLSLGASILTSQEAIEHYPQFFTKNS